MVSLLRAYDGGWVYGFIGTSAYLPITEALGGVSTRLVAPTEPELLAGVEHWIQWNAVKCTMPINSTDVEVCIIKDILPVTFRKAQIIQ